MGKLQQQAMQRVGFKKQEYKTTNMHYKNSGDTKKSNAESPVEEQASTSTVVKTSQKREVLYN